MVHVIIYFILVVLVVCLATGYFRALRAIQILEKKVEGKVAQIDDLRERLRKKDVELEAYKRKITEKGISESFQGSH